MKVDVLRSTGDPERLVCQAARGDYYEGYVGDTEYAELMKGADFDKDETTVQPEDYPDMKLWETPPIVEARTKSFIEKQLSRGHYGPWEHPQITFAVSGVSRVTMAQITRHRHMTFDVQSMRYADFSDAEVVMPPVLLTEEERVERYPHLYERGTDHFSRETGLVELEERTRQRLRAVYEQQCDEQFEAYQNFVDAGVPKEDARFLLPLGTPVNMTFSGNARTFLHLLDMRRKANAQWEIRELSEQMLDHLFEWCPYTFRYYEEHGPNKLSP